jgi:phosphatidate cytidylyltransferase
MRLRLIFGTLLAIAIVALLLLDGWLSARAPISLQIPGTSVDIGRWLCNGAITAGLVLIFTWLAARELLGFARRHQFEPLGKVTLVFSAGLVLGPYVAFNLSDTGLRDDGWGILWLALCLCLGFLLQAIKRGTQNVMPNLASTIFITFYAGGLAGYLTKLRMEVGGMTGVVLVLVSLFAVKMTDVGAYFVGTWTGRHKMIPWLSPGKTWEGLAGGVATAVVVSSIAGYLLHRNGVPMGPANWPFPLGPVLFGILMAGFSVAGDLCASLLKRDAAVKDSGDSLPGFGGILDVLDSPLLAAPAAWFFWTRVSAI